MLIQVFRGHLPCGAISRKLPLNLSLLLHPRQSSSDAQNLCVEAECLFLSTHINGVRPLGMSEQVPSICVLTHVHELHR